MAVLRSATLTAALLLLASQTGCITTAIHGISARDLPVEMQPPPRSGLHRINFSMLRQEQPDEYKLDEGDLLGVFVPNVLPPGGMGVHPEVPLIQPSGHGVRDVYPPRGQVEAPGTGIPLILGKGGMLSLPSIEPICLLNYTLLEAAEQIRHNYAKAGILQEGQPAFVTLLRPRVHRVVVLREDTGSPLPSLIQKGQTPYTRSGRGEVVDLPAYENDVLHALAATGGLPGMETYNQVWILRSEHVDRSLATDEDLQAAAEEQGASAAFRAIDVAHRSIRIPLRMEPGQPLCFTPDDIILRTGDVLYIEPRDKDVFYTGGLLPGGEVPLPRDRDIDILEAIAIANGSLGGLGGASSAVFRAGGGPGNVIPPTRAVIIRKLPQGRQVLIRVDLCRARLDPCERVIIQPGDFVMMHYRPSEIIANVGLNFFNFTLLFNPATL
jgi:hypothetical protein